MNEIVPFSIKPANLTEAMEFCKMIARSSFCPSTMRGKDGDVMMCLQMGAEIGLSPMQSLQNIAIINNKPCVWGDAALAVVQACPDYEYHREWHTGEIADNTRKAHCLTKRKGNEEVEKTFSMDDAKQAGLWKRNDVWTKYPDRMLQMRARAFAIRDQFADALKGMSVREEVEDYDNKKSKAQELKVVQATVVEDTGEVIEALPYTVEQAIKDINAAQTEDELKQTFTRAYLTFKECEDELKHITLSKEKRKDELKYMQTPVYAEVV